MNLLHKTLIGLVCIAVLQVPLATYAQNYIKITGEPYVSALQLVLQAKADEAIPLLQPLIVQNDSVAQYIMGLATAQTPAESLVWFERSAKQGYLPAMWLVFNALKEGTGAKKDEQKAFVWLLKLAQGGDWLAQDLVYAAYNDGNYGISKDEKKADYWRSILMQRNKSKSAQPKQR